MARPKKQIDPDQVEKLVAINCSVEEIADFFNVDRRTIQRRFATVLKKGRSQGKISLKRRMWETAMSNNKGSVTMQIWLSKQMLGYTDKIEQQIESENHTNVIYDTQFGTQDANAQVIQPPSSAASGPSIN